jgi:hypothetical protein
MLKTAKHIESRKHITAYGYDAIKHTFELNEPYQRCQRVTISLCNDDSADRTIVYSDRVNAYDRPESLFSLPGMENPRDVLEHIGYDLQPCDLPTIPERASIRRAHTFRRGDLMIATEYAEEFGLKAGAPCLIEELTTWSVSSSRMTLTTDDERSIEVSIRHPGFRPARYRWTVEIEVDAVWVADGFDLDDRSANDMLQNRLSWARGSEVKARVIASPDPEDVAKEQGYKSATDRKARKGKS